MNHNFVDAVDVNKELHIQSTTYLKFKKKLFMAYHLCGISIKLLPGHAI